MISEWEYLDCGGEAVAYRGIIDLEKATRGVLRYPEKLEVVYRISSNNAESSYAFVRNLAAALLDVYFSSSGRYEHRHIPSPISLLENVETSEDGYVYQYISGNEGFPWNFALPGDYAGRQTNLGEWITFCNAFNTTGIGVDSDVTDPDDETSKNIILVPYDLSKFIETGRLPPNWARIDFGYNSCPFSPRKLNEFVQKHEKELKEKLGSMKNVLKLISQSRLLELNIENIVSEYHKELSLSDIDFFTPLIYKKE